LEKERGLVNVVLDEPQGFTNSLGAHWVVTNPAGAVLRLRGRNTETWSIKGGTAASDRFNYEYSDQELRGAERFDSRYGGKGGAMHVVFNNNYEDQGAAQREDADADAGPSLSEWQRLMRMKGRIASSPAARRQRQSASACRKRSMRRPRADATPVFIAAAICSASG